MTNQQGSALARLSVCPDYLIFSYLKIDNLQAWQVVSLYWFGLLISKDAFTFGILKVYFVFANTFVLLLK